MARRPRSVNAQKERASRFWRTHAAGYAKAALKNNDTFPMFSVREAIDTLLAGNKLCSYETTPPEVERSWDGPEPRIATDRHGIPMIVYIPGLNQSHKELTTTAMDLLYKHETKAIRPPPVNSNARSRNKESNFVHEQQGTLECGVISEQGHRNHTPRPASSNTGKTVNYFDEMSAVNEAFECSREAMNGVLYTIDNEWHRVLEAVRENLKKNSAGVRAHQTLDPSLLPSHTLSWNRAIHLHADSTDEARGWSGFHATGDYTKGGELSVPALNLKIKFQPGDFILIRGVLLEHEILGFEGNRYADTSYLSAAFISQDERLTALARKAPLMSVASINRFLLDARVKKEKKEEEEHHKESKSKRKASKKQRIANPISLRKQTMERLVDTFDRHRDPSKNAKKRH